MPSNDDSLLNKNKVLVVDCDGVLTDGAIYYSSTGAMVKGFHVQDGLGLKRLLNHGIECAIITGRKDQNLFLRTKELGITRVFQGVEDKSAVVEELCKTIGVSEEGVVFIGDDLNDLPVLRMVGFPIAVANAVPEVKRVAKYVTEKPGGAGAVREVCDMLLHSVGAAMKTMGVIPARYESTRFPGKPLAHLDGYPLVYHVFRRACESDLDEVLVATDDERISEACQELGCRVVLTSKDHQSGSDRVAEVAGRCEADSLINIQGDEPLISPVLINELLHQLRSDPLVDMVTAKKRTPRFDEASNPNVVKVVTDNDGYALYFSRSPVPYVKGKNGARHPNAMGAAGTQWFKHIGIYGYKREALLRLQHLPPSDLELAESLEQLRALANGMRIRVIETEYDSLGVDTPEDLEKVRKIVAAGEWSS